MGYLRKRKSRGDSKPWTHLWQINQICLDGVGSKEQTEKGHGSVMLWTKSPLLLHASWLCPSPWVSAALKCMECLPVPTMHAPRFSLPRLSVTQLGLCGLLLSHLVPATPPHHEHPHAPGWLTFQYFAADMSRWSLSLGELSFTPGGVFLRPQQCVMHTPVNCIYHFVLWSSGQPNHTVCS